MLNKNIYLAVSWPETQELMEDPEFLNNAVLINNNILYDEYGSSSYMVRATWLMEKSQTYKAYLLNTFDDAVDEERIKQQIEDNEAWYDAHREDEYL